jgi:hypothetical protein
MEPPSSPPPQFLPSDNYFKKKNCRKFPLGEKEKEKMRERRNR